MGKIVLHVAYDFIRIVSVSIPYMGKIEQHFVDLLIVSPISCIVKSMTIQKSTNYLVNNSINS